jgi:hypothetical protein
MGDKSPITVRLVWKESGEPIPGAELFFINKEMVEKAEQEVMWLDEDGIFEYGRKFVANEKGECRIPAITSEWATILGITEGGRGRKTLHSNPSESPFILKLRKEKAVKVQCFKSDGTPAAGIKVMLSVVGENMFSTYTFGMETADKNGLAKIRIPRFVDSDESIQVSPLVVGVETESLKFDANKIPEGISTLTIPPSAPVAVEVFDEHNNPVIDPLEVSLRQFSEEEQNQGLRFYISKTNSSFEQTEKTSNGRCVFPYVGLNQKLEATASIPPATGSSQAVGFSSSTPDTEGVIRLSPNLLYPEIKFRVVDIEGTPIKSHTFSNDFVSRGEHGTSSSSFRSTKTDSNGNSSYVLEKTRSEWTSRTLTLTSSSTETPSYVVTIDLSQELLPGLHDIGNVLAVQNEVLLSGRVLSEMGNPLEDVSCTVLRKNARSVGGPPRPRIQASTQTDKEGYFTVFGDAKRGEYYVEVQQMAPFSEANDVGFLSKSIPFTPGQRDLEIVLEQGCSLKGNILLDEGIDVLHLNIKLERPSSNGNGQEIRRVHLLGNEFVSSQVRPGIGKISIGLDSEKEPLIEIPDLFFEKGVQNQDPRLKDIDLRGKIHKLSLGVLDIDGTPVPKPHVVRSDMEGSSGSRRRIDDRIQLLSSTPTVDLEVSAKNFRTKKFFGVRDGQDLVLSSGIKIELRIIGHERVNKEVSFTAYISQKEKNDEGSLAFGFGLPIHSPDENGVVQITVEEPGSYEATIWVSLESEFFGRTLGQGSAFEVLEIPYQVIDIALSDEDIETANALVEEN